MTRKRKVDRKERKKRSHQSAHRRAMTNPRVRQLVTALRTRWDSLDPLQRGDCLTELTALGCSRRGLETELKQSATSLRRFIALAGLSDQYRQAVAAGASKKSILALKASEDRRALRLQRILEDQKTGALSDQAATIILEFCRGGETPPRTPVLSSDLPGFLNEVERSLSELASSGHGEARIPITNNMERLFRITHPAEVDDPFWMAHQVHWLANVICAIAPEPPIWERALTKALNRSGELDSHKTPSESWQNRLRHSAAVIQPTNRPKYGGAKSMKRQGKPTS